MENKKPPLKALLAVICIIAIAVVGFAGIQEYTLKTGIEVYLETRPVDPRDPLRGDYVILRYEIERDEKVTEAIRINNLSQGDTLYISLSKNNNGLGTVESVSKSKPENGLFIRGQVDKWSGVDVGIGKYFVPEGTGREIEKVRSDMEVLAVIDKFGTAKIRDIYHDGEKINPDTFIAK